MAIKLLMVLAQKGFSDKAFHEIRKATAAKLILVFFAGKEKTGCTSDIGEVFLPNMSLGEVRVNDYEGLMFLGGAGVTRHINDPEFISITKKFYDAGKVVGACDAAVPLLLNAGILDDKNINDNVEIDGRIIVSKNADAARDFGDKLSDLLIQTFPERL